MPQRRNKYRAHLARKARVALLRGDPEPMREFQAVPWDAPNDPRMIPAMEWAASIGIRSASMVNRWYHAGRIPGAKMLRMYGEMGSPKLYVPEGTPRPPRIRETCPRKYRRPDEMR